jgi:hypothetical protein
MKADTHIFNIMLVVIFLFMVSCTGEEFEGPTGVKLTLKARTMLKSASDTVKIHEALIGVSKIDFRPEDYDTKSGPEKIVYNGPYVVDLLNGHTTPEIKWVFVEPGVYREVKISSTGNLRGGHSIIVRGTVKPAGVNKEVPFEFSTETEHDIIVRSKQGIVVKKGDISELMIIFELAGLFQGVDLAAVETNNRGVLMFNDDTGSGIIAGLKEKLENLSSFGFFDSNFSDTLYETADQGNGNETGGDKAPGGGTGDNEDNDGNTPDSSPGQDGGDTGGTSDPGSGSGGDDGDSSGGDSDPGDGNAGGNDGKDHGQGINPGAGSGPDEDDDDNDDGSGDNSGSDDDSSDGSSGNDGSKDDDDGKDGSGGETDRGDDDKDDDGKKDDDDDDDGDDDKNDDGDDDKDDDGKKDDGDDNKGKDNSDKGNSGKGNSGNAPGNSGNAPGNSGNPGSGNKGGNSGK